MLTAISSAISTLVSSIVAAVRGASALVPAVTPEPPAPKPEPPAPKPKPPEPPDGGVKEWIKKHFENLANAVGWVAEHLWALVVGVGALLFAYVQKKIQVFALFKVGSLGWLS